MSCKRKTIENLDTVAKKAKLDSGTLADLPLSYTNDTDTGEYLKDDNARAFVSGGNEIMVMEEANQQHIDTVLDYDTGIFLRMPLNDAVDNAGDTWTNTNNVTFGNVNDGTTTLYGAATFDGSTNYLVNSSLDASIIAGFASTEGMSTGIWFKKNSTSLEEFFVFDGGAQRFRIYWETGDIRVLHDSGSNYLTTRYTFTPDNLWHHFVTVTDQQGNKIYFDGEQVTPSGYVNGTSSTKWQAKADITRGNIGRYFTGGNYLTGSLHNMILSNTSWNDEEIRMLYRHGLAEYGTSVYNQHKITDTDVFIKNNLYCDKLITNALGGIQRTWVPVFSNTVNIDSITFGDARYNRIEDIIYGIIYMTIDPTAVGVISFDFTAPIAAPNFLVGGGTVSRVSNIADEGRVGWPTGAAATNLGVYSNASSSGASTYIISFQVLFV